MKKVFILIVLFALPVSIYIFFASAAHNFAHLPVKTKDISNLESFTSLRGDSLHFDKYVTVLCFYGKDIDEMQGNAFNLNDRIYTKNNVYTDFQLIVLAQDGTQEEARNLIKKLRNFTGVDMSKWKFAFGSTDDIQHVFDTMDTSLELNNDFATPYAFIVDKEGNLRGQKDNPEKTSETTIGYDTRSIAKLTNTMVDDLKVLLAEYRLELKRNNDDITKHKKKS